MRKIINVSWKISMKRPKNVTKKLYNQCESYAKKMNNYSLRSNLLRENSTIRRDQAVRKSSFRRKCNKVGTNSNKKELI
jgi:hypothetical protein